MQRPCLAFRQYGNSTSPKKFTVKVPFRDFDNLDLDTLRNAGIIRQGTPRNAELCTMLVLGEKLNEEN